MSIIRHLQLKKEYNNLPSKIQEHKGALNFATDAWTSPNHKAYVAVTVHFKNEGIPVSMLLGIVKLTQSHSSINLAAAFAKILEDFGISNKVSELPGREQTIDSPDMY